MPLLRKRYIETGKVKYIYRPLIWDTEEKNGRLAAEALFCAGDQDRFWEMHDWMFLNVDRWGQDPDIIGQLVTSAVPELGLDGTAFRACLETEKYRDHVVSLTNDATSRGITQTPTFLIQGQIFQVFMDITDFRKVIEGEWDVPPALQILLAAGLPALLGVFIVAGGGPNASRRVVVLRMVVGVLALLGLLVAVYLSLYELQISGNLVCPLGSGCPEVNRSDYVNMFGVPIGVIGVFGYSLILTVTLARLTRRLLGKTPVGIILVALGAFGFLFSLFLTYLQVFQIGATCTWCTTSTLLMTGILGLSIAALVVEQREA